MVSAEDIWGDSPPKSVMQAVMQRVWADGAAEIGILSPTFAIANTAADLVTEASVGVFGGCVRSMSNGCAIRWSNGARARFYTAEFKDALRGPTFTTGIAIGVPEGHPAMLNLRICTRGEPGDVIRFEAVT